MTMGVGGRKVDPGHLQTTKQIIIKRWEKTEKRSQVGGT